MRMIMILSLFISSVSLAQTAISVQDISETTITANGSNANGSNVVTNRGGDVMLLLGNLDSSQSATVTVEVQDSSITVPGYGPLTKEDIVVSLTAGQRKLVGPLKTAPWNTTNEQILLTITGSGATNVSITPFKIHPSLK